MTMFCFLMRQGGSSPFVTILDAGFGVDFLGGSYQGWTGKLFFSQGGAGRGGARPKIYRAGEGSKSGARQETYCIYQLIEIICYSKGNLILHRVR